MGPMDRINFTPNDSPAAKTASVYIRVSTEDQKREGYSLETQQEDCLAFIAQNGWQKGRIYQDVESGYKIDRPQYQQMLRDAECGKFQVLVIWKLDRLTRNTEAGLRVVNYLRSMSIEIVSPRDVLDFETARGRRNVREDMSEAEYERDKIIERITPGMHRSVRNGQWQGARQPPYGYRYRRGVEKGELGKLLEIPEEIAVVKLMYQHRAEGKGVYAIALSLFDRGVRNRYGKPFTTRQLEIILHRRLYGDGIYEWGGLQSEQPIVTPVIEPQIWQQVQAINTARRRESKSVHPGRINSSYIVQGAFKCIRCGGNMVGTRSTYNHRTGQKCSWYRCGQYSQRTRKACPGQSVKADIVHQLAFDILKQTMQNPQLIELTRRKLKDLIVQGEPGLLRRVNELRAAIRQAQHEQEKCLKAFYAEAITTEQLKAENSRLAKESEQAQKELALIQTRLEGAAAFKGKVDDVFKLLQDFETVWTKMTPVQQRVVYRGMFHHFHVEGRPRSRHFKIGNFSLKEPFKSWYDGRVYQGAVIATDDGSITLTATEDKELCESCGLGHMDVK